MKKKELKNQVKARYSREYIEKVMEDHLEELYPNNEVCFNVRENSELAAFEFEAIFFEKEEKES